MRNCQKCRVGRPERCTRQTALERQDLSRTYLAHHELESVIVIVIITLVTTIIIVIIIIIIIIRLLILIIILGAGETGSGAAALLSQERWGCTRGTAGALPAASGGLTRKLPTWQSSCWLASCSTSSACEPSTPFLCACVWIDSSSADVALAPWKGAKSI